MMKRILTLLFAIILSANVVFAEDISKVKYDEKSEVYQIVKELGIISDEDVGENENEPLTRGQFIKLAYRIKNYSDRDSVPSASASYFNDVDVYHYAAGYIQYLVGAGVVKGYENSSFRPEQNITADEAARILLRTAGYSTYEDGGNSLGSQISEIKKGLNGDVTYKDAADMIYRLLFTDSVSLAISDGKISFNNEDIVLREILNLDYYDGVIEQIGGRGLYQSNNELNTVVIDGIHLETDKVFDSEYLGMYGRVYYDKADKAVAVQLLKNEVITIDAGDIEGTEDQKLRYTDGDKEKTIKLSSEKDILYNGYPVDSLSDYLPKNGSITAIDRNANGVYDVISVIGYESYLVKSAGINSEDITLKTSDGSQKLIKTSDYDTVEIEDETGKSLTVAALTENTVVMVYSYQKEYIRLVAVNKTVEASVKGLGTNSSRKNVIRTDDAEYVLYDNYYYLNEPSVNDNVTLYLDKYDKVVGVLSSTAAGWKTGYIIFVRKVDDDYGDTRLMIKLVNESGEVEKIYCDEKITVDGTRMNTDEAYDAIYSAYNQFSDKLTIGTAESENITTRLARYYQSGDIIKRVDTPIMKSMYDETRGPQGTAGDKLVLNSKGYLYNPENKTGFRVVYGSDIKGEIYFESNALIFTVPEETNTNPSDDDYGVMKASDFHYANGKFYYVSGYADSTDGLLTEYAVVRKNKGASSELSTLMVKNVSSELNEEDEKAYILETTDGTKYEINEKDNAIEPSEVQKGDILAYELSNGKIILRTLLYRTSGGGELNKQPYYTSQTGVYHFNAEFRALLGTVGKIDGQYMQISFNGAINDETVAVPQYVDICNLTNDKVKIYRGERSDVNAGDSIIITSRKGNLRQVAIIKK